MISRYGWIGLVLRRAARLRRRVRTPATRRRRRRVAEGERGRVVFLGTSLTAGLGVDPESAYPALIQQKLDSAGLPYTAVNAGVSGETSAGALRRVDWVLREPAAVLVIETGANDGLRGLDADTLRANIQAIIDRGEPPDPAAAHRAARHARPSQLRVRLCPTFPRGVSGAGRRQNEPAARAVPAGRGGRAWQSLNQADMIHPTAGRDSG